MGEDTASRTPEEVSRRLRAQTPAVLHAETRGWSYFDGPSGTQMIGAGIDALATHARQGLSNRRGYSPAGDETEALIAFARSEVAALFLAEGYRVVFGQNMTSLAFSLGHALARQRAREGTSVVVTELEHAANVDPWVQPFAEKGATTRWLRVDRESLAVRSEDIEAAQDADISVVAVTAAANAVGVMPEIAPLRELARRSGAAFVVDGVHVVPHGPPDVAELGADVFICSGYKFYGPHVGVALVRESLAAELPAYKVTPAPSGGPEQFETGSQNHEGIASLGGTVAGLGRLVESPNGTGARAALRALGRQEGELGTSLVKGLRAIPGVEVVGHDGGQQYVATVAFNVAGRTPSEISQALRSRGVFVTSGDFYASALAARLGVDVSGGWVRAGVAGYTTEDDVARLLDAVTTVADQPRARREPA